MAYKDSDELKSDERYPLGDYSFRIERSSGTSPNYDKIEAVCTKDGKNARKSIQVPSSTQIDGWYVEANESVATIYAVIKKPGSEDYTTDNPLGLNMSRIEGGSTIIVGNRYGQPVTNIVSGGVVSIYGNSGIWVSANEEWTVTKIYPSGEIRTGTVRGSACTRLGKTCYTRITPGEMILYPGAPPTCVGTANWQDVAWTLIFGERTYEEYDAEEIMVGRFAIDLEDAGGVGPGSDWTDPGDYDPDWEEGDPTHTLYVTVTGALSGRHNDPIEDPSYSYIPADKDTVKDYGCGGDGGHGGGGGAGASTVVIHKFATNQANSKEVTAIARRHGYGSGGGKGGKGGDGCILVYY